jgi:hypothetical protein
LIEALQTLKLALGPVGDHYKVASRERKAEGDGRGGAEVLHVPALDAESGVELHRMASPT